MSAAFLCGDPPKEPMLFTSLPSGSFHLWGKSSFRGTGGVAALGLLEQLALHGCYCLRAQGTGRGAQKVFAKKQAGEEGLTGVPVTTPLKGQQVLVGSTRSHNFNIFS